MGGASSKENSTKKLNKQSEKDNTEKLKQSENKDPASVEQFFDAVKSNNFEKVNSLLKRGMDVNAKHVRTILLQLSPYASAAEINFQNIRSIPGKTALHYSETPEITQCLIKAGADVNAIDQEGYTPLHVVNNVECAKILINAGANVMTTATVKKYTPLHCVRNLQIVKLLLENGADLNALTVNPMGGATYTPLNSALFFGIKEVATYLSEMEKQNISPTSCESRSDNPKSLAVNVALGTPEARKSSSITPALDSSINSNRASAPNSPQSIFKSRLADCTFWQTGGQDNERLIKPESSKEKTKLNP